MASIECDREHPVLNDLLLHFLKGAKMEQKQAAVNFQCNDPDASFFPSTPILLCYLIKAIFWEF
jgi:hypothetical protein